MREHEAPSLSLSLYLCSSSPTHLFIHPFIHSFAVLAKSETSKQSHLITALLKYPSRLPLFWLLFLFLIHQHSHLLLWAWPWRHGAIVQLRRRRRRWRQLDLLVLVSDASELLKTSLWYLDLDLLLILALEASIRTTTSMAQKRPRDGETDELDSNCELVELN